MFKWSHIPGMLTAFCLAALPCDLRGQSAERAWRESLQLEVPLLVAKRWENARGLIEQEAWDAALTALADLESEFPDELVQVATGRYLNVSLATGLLRLNLPPAGLEAFREQIDGWARSQWESAADLRDEVALQRLVATALASRTGDEALDRLAQFAWERGEIATARSLWTQMIPLPVSARPLLLHRCPDTDHDLAAVHARLILCSLAEGNLPRAERELAQFAEQFPDAVGTLAGQTANFVELLTSQLAHVEQWKLPPEEVSWPTFAGDRTRNPPPSRTLTLGPAVWTLPLQPDYVPRWERPRPALPERGLLSRDPVTIANGVFFHDGTTIRGVRRDDGKPLWPTDVEETHAATHGKIYPPFPAISNSLPWTPVVGVPRHTLLAHQGHLYALLGPSVLTLPAGGRPASPTRLVCLDLRDEGLLKWFHTPEDLFEAGWLVTGTPVADGERLFVPLLRTEPQMEVGMAGLLADTGEPIWQKSIGQALREPLAGRVELGHQLLSYAEGQVFHSTDQGGVVAVDSRTGRVNWVVTYASHEVDPIDHSDESAVGLLPPLVHEGIVFVKPNDTDELLAIDARSGYVHWRRAVPGRVVHLLGAVGGQLYVGGHQLWSIDIETGRPRWRFGYDDAAGHGYGRGVIAGDRIVWPTHEELFVVDRQNGRLNQRVRLFDALGLTGGHLQIAGDRLLIAGPDHLTALSLSP